jgi:mycothiol synthase
MQNIVTCPFADENDLNRITHLINTCYQVDELDDSTSHAELREDFDAPSTDKAKDLRLWENKSGELVGFGSLWISEPSEVIDGFLDFYVHPDVRGGDLEAQIIDWGELRMREVKQERGFPVKLRVGARNTQTNRMMILENYGFASDRYFFNMERSLAEPIPEVQFPEGFTLRCMNPEKDVEAWVDLHNNSFIDHWNFHPLTVESLKHWLKEASYRADLDLIAVTADNTFAAHCHCHIDTEKNARMGRKRGIVGILGTRRGFRRMGLAKAMLLIGLHRLQEAGMDTARLGVDADNPNGALRLYESVGFRKVRTSINYVRDVS